MEGGGWRAYRIGGVVGGLQGGERHHLSRMRHGARDGARGLARALNSLFRDEAGGTGTERRRWGSPAAWEMDGARGEFRRKRTPRSTHVRAARWSHHEISWRMTPGWMSEGV